MLKRVVCTLAIIRPMRQQDAYHRASLNLQNIPIRTEEGRRIRQALSHLMVVKFWHRLLANRTTDHGTFIPRCRLTQSHSLRQKTFTELRLPKCFGTDFDEVTTEQRRRAKAVNFGNLRHVSLWFSASASISRATKRKPISTPTLPAILAYYVIWKKRVRVLPT